MSRQTVSCIRIGCLSHGKQLFLLCWMVYFSSYIGRFNYSVAMGTMLDAGVTTMETAGIVSTAYFLCYGIGQLVNGIMGSLYNPFRLILIGTAAAGIANIFMGFMGSDLGFVIVWALNGYFQSMIWPPIVRIFAELLPEPQQWKACVNINSTIPMGTLASYILSATALALLGWRWAFFLGGFVMLLIALVWFTSTRRFSRECCVPAQVTAVTSRFSLFTQWRDIIAQLAGAGLLMLIIPVAIHGTIKDGVTSWIPTLIQGSYATTAAAAAVISTALPIFNLIGPYLANYLNNRWIHNEVKTCLVLFAIATASLSLLPVFMGNSLPITVLLLAITTSMMLGVNTLMIGVLPVRIGKHGNAAAFSGLLNAVTYFGAAAASWSIGILAARFGWSVTILFWIVLAAIAVLLCIRPAYIWARYTTIQEQ